MADAKPAGNTAILVVLLPVVVGSILATATSLTTNYYAAKSQREQDLRKEEQDRRKEENSLKETERNERKKNANNAAESCSKLMRNLELVKMEGFPKETDLQVKTALSEMDIYITLNFPWLEKDVSQVRQNCDVFLNELHRFEKLDKKEIFLTDVGEKEVAAVIQSIRALIVEISYSGMGIKVPVEKRGIKALLATPIPNVSTTPPNG